MTRRRALIAPDPMTDPTQHKFAPVTYQPPTRSEPSAQEARPGWIWVRVNDRIVQLPVRVLEELEKQHVAEQRADLDNPLLRTLPRGPDDPNPRMDEEREAPTQLTTPDPSNPSERVPPTTFVLIRKPDGQTLRVPMLMVQRVLGLGVHATGAICHPRCGQVGIRVGREVLCSVVWAWPTWRLIRRNIIALAARARLSKAAAPASLLLRAAVEISIKIDDHGEVSVSGPPGGATPPAPAAPALDVEAKRREIADVFDKVVAEKGGPQGNFWTDGERVVYVSKAFLWALEDDPHMGLRVPPQLSGAVIAANLTDRFFGQGGVDWMNHHVPLAEWKNFRRVDRGTAERMILDRAIRQAPKVAIVAEILRQAQGPKWTAPDMSSEIKAVERAAAELGITPGALLGAMRGGKLFELGDSAWERLQGSKSWACHTLSGAREAIGAEPDRDFDHIIAAFWAGARLGAPIVLMQPDGTPYLISGDSRLMAARAFGIRPRVFVVRWPDGVVSTKPRSVDTSAPHVDPVNRSPAPAPLARVAIVKECRQEDREPGRPYCLYAHDGKLLGRHETEQDAYKQEAAIKSRGGSAVQLLDRAADGLEELGHNDLAERVDRISSLMVIAAGTGTKEPGGPPVSVDDTTPQEAVFPPDTLGPARLNRKAPPPAPRS